MNEVISSGTFKKERVILSRQGPEIVVGNKTLLNFCTNNYLNISNTDRVINATINSLKNKGYGVSGARNTCGTTDLHKKLEEKLAKFHNKEAAILFICGYDVNTGFFEPLLDKEDVIISDILNHGSIIDGIKLSKAKKKVYKHNDMAELEERLKEEQGSRLRVIVTDGVFSMDGDFAPLDKICNLAQKYDAIVVVDDSHGTAVVGKTGRGTPEIFGVLDEVDIINSTLGKGFGGACGGFSVGKKEIIDFLKQKSRPYLMSNSLMPAVAGGAIEIIDAIDNSNLFTILNENTKYFRRGIKAKGFEILGDLDCPIVPVMLGEEKAATEMGLELEDEGIFATGFCFPLVPKGEARIRVQISAGHTKDHLDRCIDAFEKIGKKKNII